MRGIGPFRDEVSIDFAALGASGMFLLEGPTGSGKSTVLDAVVYALYGSVAGEGASSERIRSQFAEPSTPSEIDLVFETTHGVYRVLRQPEYHRPKKRGEGTTKQQAKALLWRLGSPDLIPEVLADTAGQGAGLTPIASRLDEVGREIGAAVGLTRAQFTQTVLLPQNEFARFLRASTGDRQAVLQRVFGTEIYEDIEKQLEQMRREAAGQVDAANAGLAQALARFVEAACLEEDDARTELEGHARAHRFEELTAQADQIGEGTARAAQEAAGRAQSARAQEGQARSAAEAAAIGLQRIDRRRTLGQLAAALTAQEEAATTARTRLDHDRIAQPIAGAIARRDQARTHLQAREQERDAALSRHRQDHPELADLAAGPGALEALAAAVEEATTRAGELSALVQLEKNLPGRQKGLQQRSTALEKARTELADLDTQIQARPQVRAALVTARDAARAAGEGLGDAQTAADQAAARLEQARTAARLAEQVAAARAAAEKAQSAATRAGEEEAQLRRRRNAGLAAELAMTLAEGDPCPVCGATAHPDLAEAGADHVGAEQVEAAEEARRQAEQAASTAREALTLATSRHEQAREQSGGLEVDAAQAAQQQAAEALRAVRDQQAEAARRDKELEKHDEGTRTLGARREKQAVAIEGEASALTTLATAVEEDEARVVQARGETGSVQERRAAHTARARAGRELREALVAVDQAAARAQELAAEVELGPFENEQAVRAAVLPEGDRRELEALLTRRATDQSRLADGMREEGVAEADPSDEARTAAATLVETTREAVVSAQAATATADQESGRCTATAQATTGARQRLDGAVGQVRAVGEKAGAVVRVADLATGRSADGDRIQLSTYVLMRRFEEVIDAANVRLAQFSESTLELVRDTGKRGARKTGLDLLVIDHRTDETRRPETLSGGETFFVSLALALGLAELVTAEAGGVQMDTLFIDEGFGSLDPEALDRVVAEINRLAEHGRTIGVVSHVGEMKNRIAEQIHVRRTPRGPSTLTVSA
nr:SMC family ATPase [Brachybacterium muris]